MSQYLPKAAAIAVLPALFAFTGCGGSSDGSSATVMPDVEGQMLDVALSDIERAGIEDEVEVLGGGTFGVVDESNWEVCEQLPAAGQAVEEPPRLTVERSCTDETTETEATGPEAPEPEVTEPTDAEPAATVSVAETDPSSENTSEGAESEQVAYSYAGPAYEIVARDELSIGLDNFWVLTDKLDYSTDAYKDEVKLIITDIARTQGTAVLSVEVVTDIEIALLESFSTVEDFYAEYGDDYVNNVVVPKEATDWIASYSGGFDFNTNELSDSEVTFEVVWFPGGDDPEFETWKPETE